MNAPALTLALHPETFAICRLGPAAPLPSWATGAPFFSITRTQDELAIVCPQERVPAEVQYDPNWRLLSVEGPLLLTLTGILHALTRPLAAAGVAIFAVSTYDTDHLMVKAATLDTALAALRAAGYTVAGA